MKHLELVPPPPSVVYVPGITILSAFGKLQFLPVYQSASGRVSILRAPLSPPNAESDFGTDKKRVDAMLP